MICFLGLGSNLAHPRRQLAQAIQKLRHVPQTVIVQQSPLYLSAPWGYRSQPHYYNMVIALRTTLSPLRLLDHCQAIEAQHHRLRQKRFGPRTLDIDILLYGEQTLHTPRLQLPHPRLLERDFVLIPLYSCLRPLLAASRL